MGSIEVYDYIKQKWVPSNPDPDKWYQHFKDLRDGYVKPDHMGRYWVGSGTSYRKLKEMEKQQHQQQPEVSLITPVDQAIEIAKSEVERLQKEHNDQKIQRTKSRKKYRTRNTQSIDWTKFKY